MRRRPRTTIAALMLAVAAVAAALASYRAGRRAEQLAPTPPAVVWITRTGARYHRAECRYAAAGKAVGIGQVGGRRPCAYCRPPAAPAR